MHRVSVGCALACVIACGGKSTKSNEDMKQQHEAPLRAKLAAIQAAAEAGRGHASDPGVPSVAGLNLNTAGDHKADVNAIAVLYDDARDPASDPTPPLRFANFLDDDVRRAKAFVGVEVEPFKGTVEWGWAEPELSRLETAKYVLVVYPGSTTLPSLGGGREFSPGSVTSDAVLVEIAGAKVLGGFSVTAASSDKVMSQNVDGHLGADASYQRKLVDDLGAQWGKALAKGIAKRWPGADVPYNWGLGY